MIDIALDIETTGIDPSSSRVVGVGLATSQSTASKIVKDEAAMLRWLEDALSSAEAGDRLITWNGDEFDLPFLAKRYEMLGVPTQLVVEKRDQRGKYHKPLYRCRWGSLEHLDIAYEYRDTARRLAVDWALKPVAREILGIEPVIVDNRGESIAAMNRDGLQRYLNSDIEITLALATALGRPGH